MTGTEFEDGEFDIAIAHTVLMHLPRPAEALAEMIRVTRDGGLVIACDASHNAINAMLHVHETNEQEHSPLALWQAMNKHARREAGLDRNIGMKTPVLMHQAGLRDVEARVSDAVRLSFPPLTRRRRSASSRRSATAASRGQRTRPSSGGCSPR